MIDLLQPLVSVLMTAYNREGYIAQSIESVLASTYQTFELIVVDDGSTDGTVAVARSFAERDKRVQVYVNEVNLGDYPNRNKAASYAKGKYLKYLDSDDVMYPHCLQVMVSSMEQFPEAGYGLSANSDAEKPYPVCLSPVEAYREHFNGYGHFNRAPGSAIIKTEVFRKTGGFSGKRMIGDNECWFLLSRTYPLVKFQRDLVWDRVHGGQESQSSYAKAYETMRLETTKAALAHPDCPLSTTEINAIARSMKKNKLKETIKRWL